MSQHAPRADAGPLPPEPEDSPGLQADSPASLPDPVTGVPAVPLSPTPPTGRTSPPIPDPPRRPSRLLTWLGLFICMAISLPMLLPAMHAPTASSRHEARAVATSLQTWQHFQQWPDKAHLAIERFEPYLNHRSQSHRAPGLVWLHMTVFQLVLGDTPTVTEALAMARLVSCLGVIVIIAAAFWAAYSLGGHWAGPMAGLLCAANPALIYFGRLGTATVPALAMESFSVAAALWAIRPLRPSPTTERQFLGWLLCGVLAGGAILVRGPWALLDVGLVVLVLVILCPGRVSHLLGLLAALLIAVLLAAPWGIYAYEHAPESWLRWQQATVPAGDIINLENISAHVAQRNLMLLAITLPWSLWLIGAILQPFSTSSRGTRIRLFLGLVWTLAIATFFICRPGESHLANAVAVIPAFSVLLALLFSHYGELADEGRSPRTWRILRWPHLVVLLMASSAVPLSHYAYSGTPLGTLHEAWRVAAEPRWVPWVLGALLMSIALFSLLRLAARDLPRRSLAAWSLWTIVLCTGAANTTVLSERPNGRLQAMVDRTDAATLVWLAEGTATNGKAQPDPRLLLYTRDREVTVAAGDQVAESAAATNGPIYLFSPADYTPPATLAAKRIDHDPATDLALYRLRVETPAAEGDPGP